MGRITPNKPNKRRRDETAAISSSAATRWDPEDETPPQTPAANTASSTDSKTP